MFFRQARNILTQLVERGPRVGKRLFLLDSRLVLFGDQRYALVTSSGRALPLLHQPLQFGASNREPRVCAIELFTQLPNFMVERNGFFLLPLLLTTRELAEILITRAEWEEHLRALGDYPIEDARLPSEMMDDPAQALVDLFGSENLLRQFPIADTELAGVILSKALSIGVGGRSASMTVSNSVSIGVGSPRRRP